ncbi:MAG: hypothetical protein ACLFQ6_11970, partial [Candidatus Sumerlaeia bacterium]
VSPPSWWQWCTHDAYGFRVELVFPTKTSRTGRKPAMPAGCRRYVSAGMHLSECRIDSAWR